MIAHSWGVSTGTLVGQCSPCERNARALPRGTSYCENFPPQGIGRSIHVVWGKSMNVFVATHGSIEPIGSERHNRQSLIAPSGVQKANSSFERGSVR